MDKIFPAQIRQFSRILYVIFPSFVNMAVSRLNGIWRSCKTFLHSGVVNIHSTYSYLEVVVNEAGALQISSFPEFSICSAQAGSWEIRPCGKSQFLFIHQKQVYEILACDQHDLVLLETTTGKKTFFAPVSEWEKRIIPQRNTALDDHSISLWSRSLIECVRE